MRLLLVVMCVAGCDRVLGLRYIPDAPPGIDAATVCAHTAPFTQIAVVPGLDDQAAGAHEIDVWLAPDELTGILVFGTQQTGQLYHISRPTLDAPFVRGNPLTAINARSATISSPSVTADGLTLYYGAYYAATNGDIEVATRASLAEDFGNPRTESMLDAGGGLYDYWPMLNPANDRMYFVSTRGGDFDIWVAQRDGESWLTPQLVLDSPQRYERFAVPSVDDRALYYATSMSALGFDEIRVITRDDRDAPFGAPTLVQLPMTFPSTSPCWLSADHCRLYLFGQGDIYMATRTP